MKTTITCLDNDCVGMDSIFWAEHGASYLIEIDGKQMLFDTGTSWEILSHNIQKLKIDLAGVSHIILSHAHYDHTGGLMGVLSQTQHPVLVSDPLLFNQKVSQNLQTGEQRQNGIPYSRDQVEALAELLLTTDPVEPIPGAKVTGRIPHLTDFELTPENMMIENNGHFQHDELLDDRSIVIDLGEQLILLCGCCHAGLINTLMYVDNHFHKPLAAIIGGIHLMGAKAERIQKTVQFLQSHPQFQSTTFYFNHCTGIDAIAAMMYVFGDRVKPYPVGTILEYSQ